MRTLLILLLSTAAPAGFCQVTMEKGDVGTPQGQGATIIEMSGEAIPLFAPLEEVPKSVVVAPEASATTTRRPEVHLSGTAVPLRAGMEPPMTERIITSTGEEPGQENVIVLPPVDAIRITPQGVVTEEEFPDE